MGKWLNYYWTLKIKKDKSCIGLFQMNLFPKPSILENWYKCPSPLLDFKPYFLTLQDHKKPHYLKACKLIILHFKKQSYLVRTIKPISSLETRSWNLCSSVWWYKLNMKSKTVSLRRTLWLTSVQSMMLFSYWRIEVVKPGQITNLSNRNVSHEATAMNT